MRVWAWVLERKEQVSSEGGWSWELQARGERWRKGRREGEEEGRTFLAAMDAASSLRAPVMIILPLAKMSAVVRGSRMRMMTA